MKAGGFLISGLGRRLSKMDSPATPKEKGETEDGIADQEEKFDVVVCEIAPKVTYAGEGLASICKGRRFRLPCLSIGETFTN